MEIKDLSLNKIFVPNPITINNRIENSEISRLIRTKNYQKMTKVNKCRENDEILNKQIFLNSGILIKIPILSMITIKDFNYSNDEKAISLQNSHSLPIFHKSNQIMNKGLCNSDPSFIRPPTRCENPIINDKHFENYDNSNNDF